MAAILVKRPGLFIYTLNPPHVKHYLRKIKGDRHFGPWALSLNLDQTQGVLHCVVLKKYLMLIKFGAVYKLPS